MPCRRCRGSPRRRRYSRRRRGRAAAERRWCCARESRRRTSDRAAAAAARCRLRACPAATSGPPRPASRDCARRRCDRTGRRWGGVAGNPAAPLAMCTNSPSTNHSACTPRECGPEASKWEISFGCSGTLMSNRSNPAGVIPARWSDRRPPSRRRRRRANSSAPWRAAARSARPLSARAGRSRRRR